MKSNTCAHAQLCVQAGCTWKAGSTGVCGFPHLGKQVCVDHDMRLIPVQEKHQVSHSGAAADLFIIITSCCRVRAAVRTIVVVVCANNCLAALICTFLAVLQRKRMRSW